MQNNAFLNTEPMADNSLSSQSGIPEMMQNYSQNMANPFMDNAMMNMAAYPEIYYKLMPFITMTVDLLFSYGMMPTQQQLEKVSDGIFDDFCTMYPEMAAYMGKDDSVPAFAFNTPFGGGFRPGHRFRRRGLGRDLIDIWLLSQLFGGR